MLDMVQCNYPPTGAANVHCLCMKPNLVGYMDRMVITGALFIFVGENILIGLVLGGKEWLTNSMKTAMPMSQATTLNLSKLSQFSIRVQCLAFNIPAAIV